VTGCPTKEEEEEEGGEEEESSSDHTKEVKDTEQAGSGVEAMDSESDGAADGGQNGRKRKRSRPPSRSESRRSSRRVEQPSPTPPVRTGTPPLPLSSGAATTPNHPPTTPTTDRRGATADLKAQQVDNVSVHVHDPVKAARGGGGRRGGAGGSLSSGPTLVAATATTSAGRSPAADVESNRAERSRARALKRSVRRRFGEESYLLDDDLAPGQLVAALVPTGDDDEVGRKNTKGGSRARAVQSTADLAASSAPTLLAGADESVHHWVLARVVGPASDKAVVHNTDDPLAESPLPVQLCYTVRDADETESATWTVTRDRIVPVDGGYEARAYHVGDCVLALWFEDDEWSTVYYPARVLAVGEDDLHLAYASGGRARSVPVDKCLRSRLLVHIRNGVPGLLYRGNTVVPLELGLDECFLNVGHVLDDTGTRFHQIVSQLRWTNVPSPCLGVQPRDAGHLVALLGDEARLFARGGGLLPVQEFTPIFDLKSQLEVAGNYQFSSAVARLYRSGSDFRELSDADNGYLRRMSSVEGHSGAAGPALGALPSKASSAVTVWLGATRYWMLKAASMYECRVIEVADGCAIFLHGDGPSRYLTSVPRMDRPTGLSLEITFFEGEVCSAIRNDMLAGVSERQSAVLPLAADGSPLLGSNIVSSAVASISSFVDPHFAAAGLDFSCARPEPLKMPLVPEPAPPATASTTIATPVAAAILPSVNTTLNTHGLPDAAATEAAAAGVGGATGRSARQRPVPGARFKTRAELNSAHVHERLVGSLCGSPTNGIVSFVMDFSSSPSNLTAPFLVEEDTGNYFVLTVAPHEPDVHNSFRRSFKSRRPFRVVRSSSSSSPLAPSHGFRFDGDYVVEDCWVQVSIDGQESVKFVCRTLQQ